MNEFATTAPAHAVSGLTNVRWRIFFLIPGTVAINYMDRTSLPVAMTMISHEFNLSPSVQGVLLSGFFWTYWAMQIPAGMLTDRFMPRSVIAGATIGWDAFAALGAARLATIAVFLVAYVHQQAAVIALLAGTLFFLRWCGMYWTLPVLLIGEGKAGFLAGAMNFAGNISDIMVPVIVGRIAGATRSYHLALMFFATVGGGLFLCSIAMRCRRAV
ncbi:MAG: MFS transporter [Rhodopila sp.]